jgi:hypothetical protein
MMRKGDVVRLNKRSVLVLGTPRRIAGGEVVEVTWASEHDAPYRHPAHLPGFRWEEPTVNLQAPSEGAAS